MRLAVILLAALWLGCGNLAWAILDKNSSTNTSDPANGSPWENVGSVNGAGGVYLGNGWVLTAGHVGLGTFTLDIGSFAPVAGSAVPVLNADSSQADLVLFQLESMPTLPAMTISSSVPALGTQIEFVGYGHTRGDATTYGSLQGYTWSPGQAKSWGTNRVSTATLQTVFNTQEFATRFDATGGTTHEAQATVGDSGGGVFVLRLGVWELTGITDAIATVGDANRPGNTAFYGDLTYSANLSTYQSQIYSVTGIPEPGAPALGSLVLAGWGLLWRPRRGAG